MEKCDWNPYGEMKLRAVTKTTVKYRPIRGSLDESMQDIREFEEVEGLVEHLTQIYGNPTRSLKWIYQGFDTRIGWNTWLIMRMSNEGEAHPCGYSDSYFTYAPSEGLSAEDLSAL